MDNITVLRICEGGNLVHDSLGEVSPGVYANAVGLIFRPSGRTQKLLGWGSLDGERQILVDEHGDEAYYL